VAGVFFYTCLESFLSIFVMDVPVKPVCYDAVPPCLCKECQLYDVQMSDPSSFWSSCVSSSIAESTCGLADIAYPKRPRLESAPVSSSVPVPKSVAVSARPFLSRPRLGFAVSSSSCFLPSSVPAVSSSSPVAVSPRFVNTVAASPGCCSVSTVAASPVQSSPVIASSGPALSVGRPISPVAASSVRCSPRFAAPAMFPSVQRPLFWPRCPLLVPVICPVWIVVPVLIASPFGFILSFLPLLR